MNREFRKWTIVAMSVAFCFGIAAMAAASTMDDLQAAFNGESNANARYLAFADKADADGYAGAASLFRAAAKAEGIHAANHAAVIKRMGGDPKATIEKTEPKTTVENLKTAEQGEIYERDTMYPQFIAAALKAGDSSAVQTFTYAKSAEAEHAAFYGAAAKDVESMKVAKTFYVCSLCGKTTDSLTFARCAVCLNPKENFLQVS